MAKRERSGFAPPALGGSSLLVVFAVLCLTVFALLSLSTVRADSRLGEASAKAVTQYYGADAQAQEILARLRLGEHPHGVENSGDIYFYNCEISPTQELVVTVWVKNGDFEIYEWYTRATGEWTPQDRIRVWNGE